MQFLVASSNFVTFNSCPTTPFVLTNGLGCFPFAHRYLGNRFCFLFLQLLRCFSWLGSLVLAYFIQPAVFGLPHSETSGSMLVSSSPEHFVGNYVLHRLCVARYPPLALSSLTTFFWFWFFLKLLASKWSFLCSPTFPFPDFLNSFL